jgi:hypothetical protein
MYSNNGGPDWRPEESEMTFLKGKFPDGPESPLSPEEVPDNCGPCVCQRKQESGSRFNNTETCENTSSAPTYQTK